MDKASYSAHPIDSIEPLSDEPSGCRAAAIYHLQLMFTVDEFLTESKDTRPAIVRFPFALVGRMRNGLSTLPSERAVTRRPSLPCGR